MIPSHRKPIQAQDPYPTGSNMPYSDAEKRKEADRRRYYAKLGRPYPYEEAGNGDSPSQERLPGFANGGSKRGLVGVGASLKPYAKYLVAGVLIATAGLFGWKYQNQIIDRLKGVLPQKREEEDPYPETTKANRAMDGLLGFAQDVMDRNGS